MPNPGIIAAGAGLGSSLVGASSANKAAKAQQASADKQIELQREIYQDTSGKFAPFLGAGNDALAAYLYEMGLGAQPTVGGVVPQIQTVTTPGTTTTTAPVVANSLAGGPDRRSDMTQTPGTTTTTPATTSYTVGGQTFGTLDEAQKWANANKTGGTAYGGFTATPGYDFRLQEGVNALRAGQAGQSGMVSGRTMRDLTKYGQDYASSEYGNYLARLAGLTDMGTGAAANMANAGANYASQASNALAGAGNAAAAGAIGVGNAINSGIQNGLGIYGYMQGLNSTGQQGSSLAPATSLIPRPRPF